MIWEPKSKYEKIILKDVTNPLYVRHRKLLWKVYGVFGAVFAGIYFIHFHSSLIRNIRYALELYRLSLDSTHSGFKTTIFVYQYLLLFAAFVFLLVLFLVAGFFAFDMNKRNRLIQTLLQRDAANSANASQNR